MKTRQVFATYDHDVTAEHSSAYYPMCGSDGAAHAPKAPKS
jgi:hypothetical protein